MIQRIQSVYLFIALVLVVLCFFLPVAHVFVDGKMFIFNINGYKPMDANTHVEFSRPWPLIISALLICSILLITIFSYKNRILQIRLSVYVIIFSLVLAFMFYWVINQAKLNNVADIKFQLPFVFPIIAAILSLLALLAIRKDDNKVKSYDRLR